MESIVVKNLTTDLVADASLHRLCMMVSSTGVDVAVMSRVHDNALIYRHIGFGESQTPVKALEEVVYDNPLLTADFGKIDIVVDTRRFFIMDASEATVDAASARMAMLYPPDGADAEQLEVVINRIEDDRTVLVMGVERELARFLRRTFNNPSMTHRMASLARYHALRNHLGNSGKIHVLPHRGRTDVIALGHRGLMLANTFDTVTSEDSVYYTMAVARHLGYDNDADRILVGGDRALRDDVVPGLRRFVSFVMPDIFPSALARLGEDAFNVPFEILVLPLCE